MLCLVLGARRYDFKDEEGRRVAGATIHYLTLDEENGENDQMGMIPLQISARSENLVGSGLSELPGYYDVEFRQRPGRGGKPVLQAVGFKYLEKVSLGLDSAPVQA